MENRGPIPAASAAGAGLSFRCNKWGKEKRVLLAASAGLSSAGINDQQKETSRTYCKLTRHLSVCDQYRKRSNAKSSTASLLRGGKKGKKKVLDRQEE